MGWFFVWLALFYSGWLTLVTTRGLWPTVTDHWPISLTMLLGSYVAGSTPMGGGTVGFPVLVLLFGEPPALGRDFSFFIQSIGMTSASFFIFCSRQRVAWRMLGPAMLGSAVGAPLGILFFAPLVPAQWIKVLFAVTWASFGILTLVKRHELAANTAITPGYRRLDWMLGGSLGLLGGACVAAVTGVGIDMLVYAALVLVRRADLKIAIPSSVILMAFTSLVGLATKSLSGGIQPGVFENWIAAAPVVALGAPLGALVVHRVGRIPTLIFVSALCLAQFVWTYYEDWEALGVNGLLVGAAALLVFQAVFHGMHVLGRRLAADAHPR